MKRVGNYLFFFLSNSKQEALIYRSKMLNHQENQLTITEAKYLRWLAKKHLLLPTKHKKPLVKGWNKFYQETKTIEQLLAQNQEYSLRTGKLTGNYYFI